MIDSERAGPLLAAGLCAAAVFWAVLLVLVPPVLGAPRVSRPLRLAASAPYVVGALICHQKPERSFYTAGVPWAVCARCAGLYLSAAAGIGLALAVGLRRPRAPGVPRAWRVVLAVSALPTLVSWVGERAAWWQPGSPLRAWLAAPLGAAVGALLVAAARHTSVNQRKT